jgi:hypothetical protein
MKEFQARTREGPTVDSIPVGLDTQFQFQYRIVGPDSGHTDHLLVLELADTLRDLDLDEECIPNSVLVPHNLLFHHAYPHLLLLRTGPPSSSL